MLPEGTGPMQASLPGRLAGAFGGSGGSALINAVLMHRHMQRAAAGHQHPHTLPPAYPVASQAPGNPLMAAIERERAGRQLGAAPQQIGGGY